jgi:hypothetical protein
LGEITSSNFVTRAASSGELHTVSTNFRGITRAAKLATLVNIVMQPSFCLTSAQSEKSETKKESNLKKHGD